MRQMDDEEKADSSGVAQVCSLKVHNADREGSGEGVLLVRADKGETERL